MLKEKEQALLGALPLGRENAVDANILCDRIGVPRGRTAERVRGYARSLNRKGFPVCSVALQRSKKRKGFFLAVNHQEVLDYITDLTGRINGTRDRIKDLSKIIKNGYFNYTI